MQELGRGDLSDLKREVVEARNQAIKTDNQVKNLSLDVRGFEKRFAVLERRTRIASIGTNLIVAGVIAASAYMVHSVRVRDIVAELEEARTVATEAKESAEETTGTLERRLEKLEKERVQREQSESALAGFLKAVEAKQDKKAIALLSKVDFEAVGPVARKLAKRQVDEFSEKAAETAYRNARSHVSANRLEAAVEELRRSLSLAPDGRYATQGRYLLATKLWDLKRYDETIPVLEEMRERTSDRSLIDEVRFLLGASLARADRRDDAAKVLKEVVASNSRYVSAAKAYLASITSGSDLPPLSAKRSRATSSSGTTSSNNATSASAASQPRDETAQD